MSRLFGVTTDFLLKDELSEEEPAPAGCDSPLRRVTMRRRPNISPCAVPLFGAGMLVVKLIARRK